MQPAGILTEGTQPQTSTLAWVARNAEVGGQQDRVGVKGGGGVTHVL